VTVRNYALTFYVGNLAVGVSQLLSGHPDPMVLILAITGALSSALLVALSL